MEQERYFLPDWLVDPTVEHTHTGRWERQGNKIVFVEQTIVCHGECRRKK